MNPYLEHNCSAQEWVAAWGHHAICTLPPGHPGLHWDESGWEW